MGLFAFSDAIAAVLLVDQGAGASRLSSAGAGKWAGIFVRCSKKNRGFCCPHGDDRKAGRETVVQKRASGRLAAGTRALVPFLSAFCIRLRKFGSRTHLRPEPSHNVAVAQELRAQPAQLFRLSQVALDELSELSPANMSNKQGKMVCFSPPSPLKSSREDANGLCASLDWLRTCSPSEAISSSTGHGVVFVLRRFARIVANSSRARSTGGCASFSTTAAK